MRIIIPILLIVCSLCGCKDQIDNEVWRVYDATITIKNSGKYDAVEYNILSEMASKELIGTIIMFANNKIIIQGAAVEESEADVLKVRNDYIIISHSGDKVKIKYNLYSDNNKCDLYFADGTIFRMEKM